MKRSTYLIVGATAIALGLAVVALGYLQDEQAVRQVQDVLDDPDAHQAGEFVLIGIPQPATLPGPDGARPNPERVNETVRLEAWTGADGTPYHTRHVVSVVEDAAGSHWTYRNVTQEAGRPATANVTREATWDLTFPHTVFLVQGFAQDGGDVPYVWAVYDGVLRDAVQPKLSQFTGHVTTTLPGVELPPGATVYWVEDFANQCSSKFLPEGHEGEADAADAT